MSDSFLMIQINHRDISLITPHEKCMIWCQHICGKCRFTNRPTGSYIGKTK